MPDVKISAPVAATTLSLPKRPLHPSFNKPKGELRLAIEGLKRGQGITVSGKTRANLYQTQKLVGDTLNRTFSIRKTETEGEYAIIRKH